MTTLPLTSLNRHDLSFESKISAKAFVVRFDDLGLRPGDRDGVLSFLRAHAGEIKRCVKTDGTLLLRGLPLETPEHYEAALEALDYDLYRTNYGGASPRSNVTAKTFVSTDAPSPFIIGLHTEFCYQTTRPGMISFFCLTPAARYGETPLFDCEAVWRDLSPALRERLATDGLLYRRFFVGRKSPFNFRKTWRDTFQTDDRRVVEAFLAAEGMGFAWDADDNLATTLRLPAVLCDPASGEPCISITMFNADSLIHNFRHFRDRYHPAQRLALEWFVRREYSKPHTFLKVQHGDGADFTREESAEIQRSAWSNAIAFPWRTGDLLLIDNIRFGHARLNVHKPRRLIAAMADAYDVRTLARGDRGHRFDERAAA